MSAELSALSNNSRYMLEQTLDPFDKGTLGRIEDVFGVASFFRSRGIAELLMGGVVDPFFVGQMQSVAAYLYGLPRVPEAERVTSLGACLWDAVGSQCWDQAAEIAALSPMAHNPKREHEDDFLYVAFLMQRYFLAPPPEADAAQVQAHDEQQRQRLERWEEVLEGGIDPRLALCHALLDADADAWAEALLAMGDQREQALEARWKAGRLRAEEMCWLQPIWPEGLAHARLGEREGLRPADLVIPRVPEVILQDNPFVYHPAGWRNVDFQPARRPSPTAP